MELREKVNSKVMISCRDVKKSFQTPNGPNTVIEKFDLEVMENEFVVLLGPGECGKTTLINMLAGLERTDTGEIIVNDTAVREPNAERGVVYQSIALFPWYTTMQNVEYGLRMKNIPKKQRREQAQKYIDLVGLAGFEHSHPIELSGGMKQRVGIARAYCNEPVVMLMDEPFGALDAQTRYLMQDELQKIWETEKRTVVFVTNNIEEAVYLADKIVVLSNSPSTVKEEIEISLPRPRNYTDPEFLKLRKKIATIADITK